MIDRLLDGLTRKLTTTNWATLETCSHDIALRGIQELTEYSLLRRYSGGGRSTSYPLVDGDEGVVPGVRLGRQLRVDAAAPSVAVDSMTVRAAPADISGGTGGRDRRDRA